MNLLKTNHHLFLLLGACATKKNSSSTSKIGYSIVSVLCFTFLLIVTSASIVFIKKSFEKNLEDALYALLQATGYGYGTYMMTFAFVLRKDFTKLFTKFQEIRDDYNDIEVAIELFTKANERCQFITMLFIKYFIIGNTLGLIVAMSSTIAYSLIIYGDVAVDHLFGPAKFVLPWNQQTFFGWILEQSTCLLASMAYFLVTSALLSLFIGICEFHKAFYTYLYRLIKSIDESGDLKPEMVNLRSKEIFCQTIRFHVSAKEKFYQMFVYSLFLESARIYSPFIFIVMLSAIVLMSGSIFEIDLASKHPSLNFVTMTITFAAGTMNLLLYCFLGKSATESYTKYAECLYDFNWTGLPIDLQKDLIVMIQNAQVPLFYHGFNIIPLNLVTFSDTLKTVVSYYMMFKTLTE